jgi:hypothetical protein
MTAADVSPPRPIPVLTDLWRLARVPFSPGAVFTELRAGSPWVVPWLVVSVAFGMLAWLMGPYQIRAQQLVLEEAGRPVPAGLETFALISAASAPLVVLVMSALTAGILWLVVMGLGEAASYRRLYAVVIHSWAVAIIQQALVLVVLTMRGLEAIVSPADARVSLGLDLFLSPDAEPSAFVRAVLGQIGPLQIWALAVTAVGIIVLGGVPKAKSWIAATASFVVGLVIAGAVATMFGR